MQDRLNDLDCILFAKATSQSQGLPGTLATAYNPGICLLAFPVISIKNRKEEREMAQLWGGRFTKETDKLVYNFNASISFDKRFYKQDIRGSIAHVTMLAKQGILTEEEKGQIINGLESIRTDVENGTLERSSTLDGAETIRWLWI